ncbi:MAG: dephospho-CoA kinase [Clostridiales bacterium]|nr:dephospho-CoA kinase [Clostridiales bacterium]
MRIIGITGGVGAGKSTVLDYLREQYKAEVIQADEIGHEVMEPGEEAYGRIVELFGGEILREDESIDRSRLASIVFSDKEKLHALNGIVHPAVKEEILRRIETFRRAGRPCVAVEAALFLEEKYDAFCHETWYIYTNEEQRRRRLESSRGYTSERIDSILRNQKSHQEFLARCQFVIDNNKTAEETRRQIDKRMRQ